MNRDVAQLIALSIDNEETLYSFALVCRCTAAGVRRVTPIKKIEFELRKKKEFREGMIDGLRSLFVVGSKFAENLNPTGNNSTIESFSQRLNNCLSTQEGRELLGKVYDKWIDLPPNSLTPEYQCLIIMLIPILSYYINNMTV